MTIDLYDSLKRQLLTGWNTWNARSVLSHVLLPQGVAVNLGLREYAGGACLKEALIGRFGDDAEQIQPGAHSYDGSYTTLNLQWKGIEVDIESGHDGDDLIVLVTPRCQQLKPAGLIVELAMLWNRSGLLQRQDRHLEALLPTGKVTFFSTVDASEEAWADATGPYLLLPLGEAVGISSGRPRSMAQIRLQLQARQREHEQAVNRYGGQAELYRAMQTCLAWDTIYEPSKDRAISVVSRLWACATGGYVMFCWDNYFAGLLAAPESKGIAYSNVIEMTRERVARGFVPNCAHGVFSSHDRSQPPVGAMVVRQLYEQFGDRWLLELLFDDLLAWNRWWDTHRRHGDYLCWGSTPYEPRVGNYWETTGVNETYGGALESGLDNSPMYDDIPFDTERHIMQLADVGLMGLYGMDCAALAAIADVLGRPEAAELRARGECMREALATCWCEETGIFLNQRTDTGKFSLRLSPTNFYPLLAGAATQAQAQRMVDEHFYNPDEFWGEWIMPSIARHDPAFTDQSYWRGRIWAPMNFLVYLGLLNYDLPSVRRDLAERSANLILKEWREHRHVHENYCPDTGMGCNRGNSDRFYHWGGLLSLIALIDSGAIPAPRVL